MGDASRVAQCVLKREHCAPRVSQQNHLLKSEVSPHLVKVIDIRLDRDIFRPNVSDGSTTSSLIIIDEVEGILESIKVRQKIVVVEIWPTMEHDNRSSATYRSGIERRIANLNVA